MRKLVFVSDIHSNLEALNAVLDASEGEELFCLGDSVGYGANPNEVIAALKDRGARAVMGNHDSAAVSGVTSGFNSRAAMAIVWTRGRINMESMVFLRGLPTELREEFEGVNAYMAHGSPDDRIWEYVDPRTHTDLFPHYLAETGADLIALGHTHVPYAWRGHDGQVFNPGSVGQPRDGDPRAGYAVVTFDGGRADVSLRRAEYDVKLAARKIIDSGLPRQLADRLFVGQ